MSPKPAAATPPPLGEAHRSLRDQVYVELRERIIEGAWPAGHRLVERELADELRVSRVPVREAVQQLQSEGFVTVLPRRGAVVAPFGAEEAAHFFAVREPLEALAARLAAQYASPQQLRETERLLTRARQAAASGRIRELVGLNADFHQQVVAMAANPLLADLMAPLDGRLRRLFRLTSTPADSAPMCGQHEELFAAIRAGDADRAAELAARHVAGTREAALTALDAEG